MAPSMIVRCPRDDDEGGTDCGVLCSDGRSLPELSTGSKNVLDSFGTLKSNQPENFGQRTPPRCRPCSGRTILPKAMSHAKMYAWQRSADICPVTKGVLSWLTSSFSARARVHQSQPGSRLSGLCSKAFLAFLFLCAARPAVKYTNGIRRMRGPAMTRRRRG
jgi:hypothetical protein